MNEQADPRTPALQAALAYSGRGWLVFPIWWARDDGCCACGRGDCSDAAKHPISGLAPHGVNSASSDSSLIERWWRHAPRANIGIRTGAASGLLVLDLDGEAGTRSLHSLVERYGRLAASWARTGSGGWHAYLRHPGRQISNSVGRLGPGIDVRADGGYVVAPPSVHRCGERYRWHGEPRRELPAPPPWLIGLVTARRSPEQQFPALRRSKVGRFSARELERQARKVAEAPVGRRNDTLYRASFRIGRFLGAGLIAQGDAERVLEIAAAIAGEDRAKNRATIGRGLADGARLPLEVL